MLNFDLCGWTSPISSSRDPRDCVQQKLGGALGQREQRGSASVSRILAAVFHAQRLEYMYNSQTGDLGGQCEKMR